jgi:hypothetical protein
MAQLERGHLSVNGKAVFRDVRILETAMVQE